MDINKFCHNFFFNGGKFKFVQALILWDHNQEFARGLNNLIIFSSQ